jgi:hypothetical protein
VSKDLASNQSSETKVYLENGELDGQSTWSTTGNLNTAREGIAGSGTQNSALSFGGDTGSNSAVTEKRIASQQVSPINFSLMLLSNKPLAEL